MKYALLLVPQTRSGGLLQRVLSNGQEVAQAMPDPIDPRDRRQFARVPVGVIARVETENRDRRFYSKDISAGGIFLLAEEPLPEETKIELEIFLPLISSPVRAKGEVVWIERQEPSGFAVQFTEISDTAQDLIRWVVNRYLGENHPL